MKVVREFFADTGILFGLFCVIFSIPFVAVTLPFVIIGSILEEFNEWSKSWFLDPDDLDGYDAEWEEDE